MISDCSHIYKWKRWNDRNNEVGCPAPAICMSILAAQFTVRSYHAVAPKYDDARKFPETHVLRPAALKMWTKYYAIVCFLPEIALK